jgi:hypothetical protein
MELDLPPVHIEHATKLTREGMAKELLDIAAVVLDTDCRLRATTLVQDVRKYTDELGVDSVVSYSHNTLHRLYKKHPKVYVDFALKEHWRQWGANQERLEQGVANGRSN